MTILSLELMIFCIILLVYMKLRKTKPDLFFPAAGITVFLPPNESDLKPIKDYKEAT